MPSANTTADVSASYRSHARSTRHGRPCSSSTMDPSTSSPMVVHPSGVELASTRPAPCRIPRPARMTSIRQSVSGGICSLAVRVGLRAAIPSPSPVIRPVSCAATGRGRIRRRRCTRRTAATALRGHGSGRSVERFAHEVPERRRLEVGHAGRLLEARSASSRRTTAVTVSVIPASSGAATSSRSNSTTPAASARAA